MQPTGSDFTPGAIELKIKNTTGVTLDQLLLSYDVYGNNDQGRVNSLTFSYSTDGINFLPVPFGGSDPERLRIHSG